MLAFVTLSSQEFLPQFYTLHTSIRKFHPDNPIILFTIGDPHPIPDGVETIPLDFVPGDPFSVYRPSMISSLISKYKKIAFMGADTELFQPMTEADNLLDREDVAMAAVPCLLKPLSYTKGYPLTQTFVRLGNINTDFILAKDCPQTTDGLKWWQEACNAHCRLDIHNGIFNEHGWFSLLPMMMENFKIWRTFTHNVCYWNVLLYNFHIDTQGRPCTIGGPITHYHYSGYDPNDSDRKSKYCHNARAKGALALFYREYGQKLQYWKEYLDEHK